MDSKEIARIDQDLTLDFLRTMTENLDNLKIYSNIDPTFKNLNEIILYHGTSSIYLPFIERNGLKPRNISGVSNGWGHGSLDDHVYLAVKNIASRVAELVTNEKGGRPVLVEAKVLTKNLAADEDNCPNKSAVSNYTWYQSLCRDTPHAIEPTCTHVGTVPVTRILSTQTLCDDFLLPNEYRRALFSRYVAVQEGTSSESLEDARQDRLEAKDIFRKSIEFCQNANDLPLLEGYLQEMKKHADIAVGIPRRTAIKGKLS